MDTASVPTHVVIETLREVPFSSGKAAAALVGAYDEASALVKMVPLREARFDVRCVDDNEMSLAGLNPILAVEMLARLIEDPNVTHVSLHIAPS